MKKIKSLSLDELDRWIGDIDEYEIFPDTSEINGVRVHVRQDTNPHVAEISMKLDLIDYNLRFVRVGVKELARGHWVATSWYGWNKDF